MYRVLDALLGQKPTDWSAEYLTIERRDEAREAEREKKLDASRLPGTSPSLPLDGYAGAYLSDLWGTMNVSREGDGLVLHYSPDFVADLQHWHHDIFRAEWRTPGDGRSFVTFNLDEHARITGMSVEDFGSYRKEGADMP